MSSSRVAPSVYAHSARAEWGRAVIAEEQPDRTKYIFENAGERTILNSISHIQEVDLPAEEREALAKSLLRRRGAATAAAKKKAAAAKGAKAAPGEPPMTFERQEAVFLARFPEGFADPKYLAEERTDIEALIAFAREKLAQDRLEAAIGRGAFAEVHADAVAVVVAAQRLSFPKPDKPALERLASENIEKFATTLSDLLHGKSAYTPRFNAFAKALGAKNAPWTIATIFAAVLHPEAHVLVKGGSSQRQAKALGLAEPPSGSPSGATYAKCLAVTHALRDRLVAAGHTPRDLFDVYTYQWRTLTRSAISSASVTAAAAAPA